MVRPLYADPQEARDRLAAAQSVAQAATALSQFTNSRNIRMMGVQAGDKPKEYINRTEIDRAIVGLTSTFVSVYFLPNFALYWSLREKWMRLKEYRKVDELDRSIEMFRGPYSLYRVIHEMAMTGFDMKFDQYHTIATMLNIPDNENQPKNTGPTYLAADAEELESQARAQFAARDRLREINKKMNEKAELPTFEEALELAKENKDLLLGIRPVIPSITKKEKKKPKPTPQEAAAPQESEEESDEALDVEFFEPTEEEAE